MNFPVFSNANPKRRRSAALQRLLAQSKNRKPVRRSLQRRTSRRSQGLSHLRRVFPVLPVFPVFPAIKSGFPYWSPVVPPPAGKLPAFSLRRAKIASRMLAVLCKSRSGDHSRGGSGAPRQYMSAAGACREQSAFLKKLQFSKNFLSSLFRDFARFYCVAKNFI